MTSFNIIFFFTIIIRRQSRTRTSTRWWIRATRPASPRSASSCDPSPSSRARRSSVTSKEMS
jgi:hypothetical protein